MVNKRNRKKQQSKLHNYTENINVEIDYDKLAKAIVSAQNQVDEDKAKEQDKQKEERLKEWHKIVHYKECSENSGKIKMFLYNIRNVVCAFYVLITFKRENAKNDSITFSLFQSVTSILFSAIEWLFYMITVSIVLVIIKNNKPVWLIYGLVSFIFARIFRAASFEIDNMKDRQYLIAIFSSITSFLALIITIIALFKG